MGHFLLWKEMLRNGHKTHAKRRKLDLADISPLDSENSMIKIALALVCESFFITCSDEICQKWAGVACFSLPGAECVSNSINNAPLSALRLAQTFDTLRPIGKWQVWRSIGIGGIWTTKLYDEYHEHYFLPKNSPTREAFESAARSYSAWYHKSLPTNKNAKILDIGCGMGHFLYFLEKEGYANYWGIDLSPSQVQYVRENITTRVTFADVFDYLNTNGAFDIIAANDILEHISKDKTLDFLTLAFNSLNSSGSLFLKTPNMSNPFSLKSRYQDFTHEAGYTQESLRYVLSASGFQEIEIIGASYVAVSFKSRIGKLTERILHKIIQQMFALQGYTRPSILAPNIIAICRKPSELNTSFVTAKWLSRIGCFS
jgi:2-polyprenyl-3-methyl-5-hydroxy-6-metoxy-1,4-benzoquinol methylase